MNDVSVKTTTVEPFAEREAKCLARVKKETDSAAAWNDLGWLYHKENRLDSAEEAYRKAMSLDPAYEKAYVNLGDLFRNEKKDVAAAEKVTRPLFSLH